MGIRMWMAARRILVLGMLFGLISACTSPPVAPPETSLTTSREPWVLIDTKTDTLSIMQGQQPVRVFPRIAVGRSGVGLKVRRGDNKTPLGVFRVGWFNDQSRFKTFIGLDYPNLDYAERALREHRIDWLTYEQVRAAWANGHTPPQNTLLGGQIGIHGVGIEFPRIHNAGINWTNGCIALDNQQIAVLRSWVKKGTRVEIR